MWCDTYYYYYYYYYYHYYYLSLSLYIYIYIYICVCIYIYVIFRLYSTLKVVRSLWNQSALEFSPIDLRPKKRDWSTFDRMIYLVSQ